MDHPPGQGAAGPEGAQPAFLHHGPVRGGEGHRLQTVLTLISFPTLRTMRTLIPMLLFAAAALPAAAQPGPARDPLNALVQGERHSPVVGTLRSGAPPTCSYDLKYMRCVWDLDPDDH